MRPNPNRQIFFLLRTLYALQMFMNTKISNFATVIQGRKRSVRPDLGRDSCSSRVKFPWLCALFPKHIFY